MPQKVRARTNHGSREAEMKALASDDPRVIGEYRLQAQLGAAFFQAAEASGRPA
jgi:hypothetical protein